MSPQTIIIVGAGLAGAKAAEELRERGFDGRLLLIGAETERPYERPPLSKDYLRGESDRTKAYVHDEAFYAEREIELRTGVSVTGLDPGSSTITLENGRTERYHRLLLATGAAPRRIQLPGADLDGVHYLRTLEDSDALRERLAAGGHVAVVGAGWIGSEFAASARQQGLEVTLIDPTSLPNERIFGAEVGSFYRDLHAAHGVELRLGEQVEAFEGSGSVAAVRLRSGQTVECDFAVVGIGVVPAVELARSGRLKLDNGVLVNDRLQTSAGTVFAAGDLANAWHPFYGRHIRTEHWANALNQGPLAARAMLDQPAVYDRLPYFFSDQYEAGMEYLGYTTHSDQVVLRGSVANGEFMAFWLQERRVAAAMNVNVWGVTDAVKSLIRSRRQINPAALADPDTPLEGLVGDRAPETVG